MGPATPPILCFSDNEFCFGVFACFLLDYWVRLGFFALKQRFFVCFFLPFKTRPLLALCSWCLSLSLSLSLSCCLVVLLLAVVAFLFLSSSGAGETQTALRFVVPLVSLRPAHALRLQPVHRAPHFPLGVAPAPAVFFVLFCFRCRRLSLSLSLSVLSLSLSLKCRSPLLASTHERIDGGGLPDGAPNYHHDCFWVVFGGRVSDSVPDSNVPNCRCSPPLPPAVP